MKSADYVTLEDAERIKGDPSYEPPGVPIEADKQHPPVFSDEALALRFAERHAD